MNQMTVPFLRPDAFEPEPADQIDLGRLPAAARRRWPLAALGALAGIALAVLYLATTPAAYTAMSRVLVEEPANRVLEEVSPAPAVRRTDAAMLTEIEIITSTTLAERVVRDLQLWSNASFMNPPTSLLERALDRAKGAARRAVALLRETVSGSSDPASPPRRARVTSDVTDELLASAASRLKSGLVVGRAGRSYAISIGYEASTPELAQAIANAYTRAYVADGLREGLEASERAGEWMEAQLDRVARESEAAAMTAARFRVGNDLATAGGQLLTQQQLGELTTQLVLARGETARAEARLEQFEDAADRPLDETVAEPRLREDGEPLSPALGELRESFREVDDRAREVIRRFGADHPQAVALREQREALERSIGSELGRARRALVNARDVARAREDALEASVGEVTGRNAAATEAQAQLNELERRAEALSAVHTGLIERFGTLSQQSDYPISRARVLSEAGLPRGKSSPSSSKTLALLTVLGAMAGAGLGVLVELRDTTLRSAADVRRAVGAPFLGHVPLIGTRRPRVGDRPFHGGGRSPQDRVPPDRSDDDGTDEGESERVRAFGPAPGCRDAARMLAAAASPGTQMSETLLAVHLAARASGGRRGLVIGLGSAEGGEGASTLAANLAVEVARSGSRVLLIDADLHASSASRRLAPGAAAGLRDALGGTVSWRSVVGNVAGGGFALLPAGSPHGATPEPPALSAPLPASLLASPAMGDLIEEARDAFDCVVVDMAPLGQTVEARALAPAVDGIVAVARWGRTGGPALRAAIADCGIGDRLIGVVLNATHPRRVVRYEGGAGRRPRSRAASPVGLVHA